MKNLIYGLIIALFFPLLLSAQTEKAVKELKKAEKELRKLHRRMSVDEQYLMEKLHEQLPEMEREFERLENIEIPEIHIPEFDIHFDGIEPFSVDIPEIVIPPMPPMPPVHIDIADIHLDMNEEIMAELEAGLSELRHLDADVFLNEHHFEIAGHPGNYRLFRNLSDREQLRLTALRNIRTTDGESGLKALKKAALSDASEAIRYTAVRKLAGWIKDQRVVPLLGKIAREDNSLLVRKAAIDILGRSGDSRAVPILQDLIE